MKDRFDLSVTAASREAIDDYIAALDLLLSANTGAEERLARAIDIDPEFALAHIAYARLLQLQGRMPEARQAATRAMTAPTVAVSTRRKLRTCEQLKRLSGWWRCCES